MLDSLLCLSAANFVLDSLFALIQTNHLHVPFQYPVKWLLSSGLDISLKESTMSIVLNPAHDLRGAQQQPGRIIRTAIPLV